MMKITVTEKHCRLGTKNTLSVVSTTLCPVARAMHQAGFRNIQVGVNFAARKDGTASITLPPKAVAAISGMCGTMTMKPFSFSLTNKQVAILKGE